uniref:Phage-related protein n=1 Tax=Candidatus Kentrum sp. LPFa TaxID=2126335 RepID=A0A450WHU8_9GAMM|nr:MAG: Phage-related protein [Candidatus Kentron sp. LPFa]
MKKIRFDRMAGGRSPIGEFPDALSSKQAQKVIWVLQLVEEIDPVPDRYFKKLAGSDGIWEIRIDAGNNTFRILGFLDGKELVVLNHAFQKKTRKTSSKEIHLAENRKRDYLARKNHHE